MIVSSSLSDTATVAIGIVSAVIPALFRTVSGMVVRCIAATDMIRVPQLQPGRSDWPPGQSYRARSANSRFTTCPRSGFIARLRSGFIGLLRSPFIGLLQRPYLASYHTREIG